MPKFADRVRLQTKPATAPLITEPGSYLCPRCRLADFSKLFSCDASDRRHQVLLEFPSASAFALSQHCVLCQVLQCMKARSILCHSAPRPSQLRAITTNEAGGMEAIAWLECDLELNERQLLPPATNSPMTVKISPLYDPSTPNAAEHLSIQTEEIMGVPSCIRPRSIDFQQVRTWMNTCSLSHAERCEMRYTFVPGLRVVDCDTRRIVPACRGCRYAALSYVWGVANDPDDASTREALPETLPQTIEDAIQVTRKVNLRFLWVDRYCIPERMKREHIRSMHKIYHNAEVTIIAAAGEGPGFGLPGVGHRSRVPHFRVRLGSHLLISSPPDPQQAINCSKWATRGWTYQEGLFSRRMLVFTDHQVYFQCGKRTYCNTTNDPSRCFELAYSEQNLWQKITAYSQRQLSRPTDALNGMMGILQAFQETEDCWLLCGIPVQKPDISRAVQTSHGPTWDELLWSALLWGISQPARRRSEFPSWSWTGWYGFTHETHRMIHAAIYYPPESSVSVEGPGGSILNSSEVETMIANGHGFLHDARFLHITALTIDLEIRSRFTSPAEVINLNNSDTCRHPKWAIFLRSSGSEHAYEFELTTTTSTSERLFDMFNQGFRCKGLVFDAGPGEDEGLPSWVYYPAAVMIIGQVQEGHSWVERIGRLRIGRDHVRDAEQEIRTLRLG